MVYLLYHKVYCNTIALKFLDDIRTPYGSGGQSEQTSETNEDVPKLSSKTSLTPSDAHKVVIEVSDSDADNKGIFSIKSLKHISKTKIVQQV